MNITPALKKILDEEFCPGDLIAKVLAYRIYKAIAIDKVLPLGSRFPTYRQLAAYMKLANTTMAGMCDELKNVYGVIETFGSNGTWIVKELPKKKRTGSKLNPAAEVASFQILLDQHVLNEYNVAISDYRKMLEKEKSRFYKLPERFSRARHIPGLAEGLAKLISQSTGTLFYENEVSYFSDRQRLFYTLIEAALSPKQVFVMTRGCEVLIRETVEMAHRRVEFVASDGSGILMDDLERLCTNYQVGIVYFSSGFPFPLNYFTAAERIKELLVLREKYNFKIIVEDCYPEGTGSADLLKNYFPCSKEFLFFIRTLSVNDPELNRVYLIASSRRSIAVLNRRLIMCRPVNPELGYAISNLMASGAFAKAELKASNLKEKMVDEAMNKFIRSGLWKSHYISYNSGCYFYLEPINGVLRTDAYQELLQKDIHIVDPELYDMIPKYKNGILIGIGRYSESNSLIRVLDRFNKYAKPMIMII